MLRTTPGRTAADEARSTACNHVYQRKNENKKKKKMSKRLLIVLPYMHIHTRCAGSTTGHTPPTRKARNERKTDGRRLCSACSPVSACARCGPPLASRGPPGPPCTPRTREPASKPSGAGRDESWRTPTLYHKCGRYDVKVFSWRDFSFRRTKEKRVVFSDRKKN